MSDSRHHTPHDLFIEHAKDVMRALMGFGNFDEFRDHREPDELNAEAAEIIASFLKAERGLALSERMLDAPVSPSAQVPASLQLSSGATQAGRSDKQGTPRVNAVAPVGAFLTDSDHWVVSKTDYDCLLDVALKLEGELAELKAAMPAYDQWVAVGAQLSEAHAQIAELERQLSATTLNLPELADDLEYAQAICEDEGLHIGELKRAAKAVRAAVPSYVKSRSDA